MRNNPFFEHLNRGVRNLIHCRLQFSINDVKHYTGLFLSCHEVKKESEEESAQLLSTYSHEVKDNTTKINSII